MTIDNIKSLEFFSSLASENPGPAATKLAANNDFSRIDASFVGKYSNSGAILCDLGSGTGSLVNKIYDKFSKVICVEPFTQFSKFIENNEKLEIVNSTFENFVPTEKFDIITAFGFLQYFNLDEAQIIYDKIAMIIKDKGILLVKNQFGVNENVEVNSWSEALNRYYFSQYRTLDQEKMILRKAGFQFVTVHDIYPAECSHWDNTHYYCLVCSKNDILRDTK